MSSRCQDLLVVVTDAGEGPAHSDHTPQDYHTQSMEHAQASEAAAPHDGRGVNERSLTLPDEEHVLSFRFYVVVYWSGAPCLSYGCSSARILYDSAECC